MSAVSPCQLDSIAPRMEAASRRPWQLHVALVDHRGPAMRLNLAMAKFPYVG